MKIKIIFLFLIVISMLVLYGCSSKRNISTLESSITGHWQTIPKDKNNAPIDYYFGKNELIYLEKGTKETVTYKVVRSNESENWIEINTSGTSNSFGHTSKITFSNKERTELTEKVSLDGLNPPSSKSDNSVVSGVIDSLKNALGNSFAVESKLVYIDNKISP
ncbi:hypothetical protein [Paenibacillus sp. KN14-4R]|uniref:hypothetical protein n=1 Tax=Paenibacillus sp. KN14-4R TaxID=3445773 RepID=UPI003F9FCD42